MSLKRIAAALSCLLLLQLTLLSGGALCGPHGDGHAMPTMASASQQRVDAPRPASSGGGCDAQPMAHCASMASCTLQIAASAMILSATTETSSSRLPDPAAVRADRSILPDVPPPRA
jgi:hypothetical protein